MVAGVANCISPHRAAKSRPRGDDPACMMAGRTCGLRGMDSLTERLAELAAKTAGAAPAEAPAAGPASSPEPGEHVQQELIAA